ncbi:MAG: TonB-dependent receptor [Bernardetiaceae bacterium]|nr:TonB-dependent receptor [Bernardetiaceae bacterium]
MRLYIYFTGLLIIGLQLFIQTASAQERIEGEVSELKRRTQEQIPLEGATVIWLGTTQGTITNEDGYFSLEKDPNTNTLIVSYVGFTPDTITVGKQSYILIALASDEEIDGIVVESKSDLQEEVQQAELIGLRGLRKAACCNLAESFETNASVDAGNVDAITGTRQIRMLGLDGIYAQLMTESLSTMRGLNIRTGLHFIPGTWLKSVAINKGAGSVINGYESITGQINTELVKPEFGEKLFLNLYANTGGRFEFNAHATRRLSDKWSTALLLHASDVSFRNDMNNDGFLSMPLYTQVNAMNRWRYDGENVEAQFGARVLYEDKFSGSIDFNPSDERTADNPYGFGMENFRAEGFAKLGIMSKTNPSRSLGNLLSIQHQEQNAFWGLRNYEGIENYLMIQSIFQTDIFNEKYNLRASASYTFNQVLQRYTDAETDAIFTQDRTESVPAVMTELVMNPIEPFTAVAGIRYDQHNLFGGFFTPRLHLRYDIAEKTTLRASGGRGFRVANIIPENTGYFANSRRFMVLSEELRPEIAWNYGASLTHSFTLGDNRKGLLTVDFYRTDFENQIVIDLENPHELAFYNLDGRSFANSFQISAEYEVLRGLELNTAYKYYQIETTYRDGQKQLPFVPQHRVFFNAEYNTKNDNWGFDLTAQWMGRQRIPDTSTKPESFQLPTASPSFMLFSGQITRRWDKLEVYVGGENLLNYIQARPILDASNPFSEDFDASMIWGPVMGRVVYAGLRFTIE